jgi:hypothetical protein
MTRTITTSAPCECCVTPNTCINASRTEDKGGTKPDGTSKQRSECNDYVTAETQQAPQTGIYRCSGTGDDASTIRWSDGTQYFSAGSDIGPCFGLTPFSFDAYITKGSTVSCTGESWAGPAGCRIICCYISAP